MTQKDINNWIMYHEIHQLSRLGFSALRIARHLVLDSRTVKKLLSLSEADYERHLLKNGQREKTLTPYQDFVREKLNTYPDTSTAQIHDWLKESYPLLPQVSPRSVYNFVMFVRQQFNIPVLPITREYFPVQELSYGSQSQVDFGQYNMRQGNGMRKKVWFFAMVLSRSRMKFICFSDVPYTAQTVCQAHEHAFAFFGGIPHTIVYDQDRTMLVDENMGDLILTAVFKQYTRLRNYQLHFCRKKDPESKGKIENVIQYVKKNFLYNRPYSDLEALNIQALAWLARTANSLIHNYTKKSPESEFAIEKLMLQEYTPLIIEPKQAKMYHVRKTNSVAFKSNFYSLPMGTYQGPGTQVRIKEINNTLQITRLNDEWICTHQLNLLSGQTIINSNHKRDNSKSMEQLREDVAGRFSCKEVAHEYLNHIKSTFPRYARDHYQAIEKALIKSQAGQKDIAKTLEFCIKNELFNGYEFEQVLLVITLPSMASGKAKSIVLLDKRNLQKAGETPDKSDIHDYEKIINP